MDGSFLGIPMEFPGGKGIASILNSVHCFRVVWNMISLDYTSKWTRREWEATANKVQPWKKALDIVIKTYYKEWEFSGSQVVL